MSTSAPATGLPSTSLMKASTKIGSPGVGERLFCALKQAVTTDLETIFGADQVDQPVIFHDLAKFGLHSAKNDMAGARFHLSHKFFKDVQDGGIDGVGPSQSENDDLRATLHLAIKPGR